MTICGEIFCCCAGVVILFAATLFYVFGNLLRKGKTKVIRGPFGFRVEVDENESTGDGQGGRHIHLRRDVLAKGWTCTCGASVAQGQQKCPSCGKSADMAITDADDPEPQDKDDDNHGDPLSEGMIDLS